MHLGEMLVSEGLITPAQLEAGLAAQKSSPDKKIGEILLEQGVIDVDTFMRVLERQLKDEGLSR